MPKQTRSAKQSRLPRSAKTALWGTRFWAWLIDAIIIWIIATALSFPGGVDTWHFGVMGVIGFLYWTLLESDGRQSVGKKAMKIRLVMANGRNADMASAAISAIGKGFLLPIDLIIGVIARPNEKLRLFNIASNTAVVKE